jgi:hypothetical protein
MIIPVRKNVGKLLSGCTTDGFSTRSQLLGISYNLVGHISGNISLKFLVMKRSIGHTWKDSVSIPSSFQRADA